MPELQLPMLSANRVRLREAKLNAFGQGIDLLMIWASLWAAIRAYPLAHWSMQLHTPAAIAVGLFCLVGHARGLYRHQWWTRSVWYEVREVLTSWAFVVAPLVALGFITKTSSAYSRVTMLAWFVSAPLAISLYRIGVRWLATTMRGMSSTQRRVAIVGMSGLGAELAQQILRAPALGLTFTGIYDDRLTLRGPQLRPGVEPLHHAGSIEDLITAARECVIDVVYIALPLGAEERINEVIRRLQDTTASVYIAFDFGKLVATPHMRLRQIGEVPVIALSNSDVPWSRRRQQLATSMVQTIKRPFQRRHNFEDSPERSSVRRIRRRAAVEAQSRDAAAANRRTSQR
jgi:putative colanic acid biosynthesis UDP-glucose lipid carrier transferase